MFACSKLLSALEIKDGSKLTVLKWKSWDLSDCFSMVPPRSELVTCESTLNKA